MTSSNFSCGLGAGPGLSAGGAGMGGEMVCVAKGGSFQLIRFRDLRTLWIAIQYPWSTKKGHPPSSRRLSEGKTDVMV